MTPSKLLFRPPAKHAWVALFFMRGLGHCGFPSRVLHDRFCDRLGLSIILMLVLTLALQVYDVEDGSVGALVGLIRFRWSSMRFSAMTS